MITGDQADGNANTSKTPGATDTMKVGLGISIATAIVGKVLGEVSLIKALGLGTTYVVDHERNGLDVDTARQNIGSDKNFGKTRTEGVDNHVTLATFEITSQASDRVAIVVQALLELHGCLTCLYRISVDQLEADRMTYPHEDDGRADGHKAIETHQGVEFVCLCWTVEV